MRLKEKIEKRKLIKSLNKELEIIWRFDWASSMFDERCKNEKLIQRYEQARENVKQLKSILVAKFGKEYIL